MLTINAKLTRLENVFYGLTCADPTSATELCQTLCDSGNPLSYRQTRRAIRFLVSIGAVVRVAGGYVRTFSKSLLGKGYPTLLVRTALYFYPNGPDRPYLILDLRCARKLLAGNIFG